MARLKWEPKSLIHPSVFADEINYLTDMNGGFSILNNGTALYVKNSEDNELMARELSEGLDGLYNFSVMPMDTGSYIVRFHASVCVLVTKEEIDERREEIRNRIGDLIFEGEKIVRPEGEPYDHLVVGLYARGKLHSDVHNFKFYKRI